jgi:hypothetical protein
LWKGVKGRERLDVGPFFQFHILSVLCGRLEHSRVDFDFIRLFKAGIGEA